MLLFVTGGTGFLGSHFLEAALAAGVRVRALRRPGSKPRIRLGGEPGWTEGNLGDARPEWFEDCDVLVHLAAVGVSPQVVGWGEAHAVNVADSLRLVEAAHTAGVRRLLVCGTCMEYGKSAAEYEKIPPDARLLPVGPYATSKAAFFLALRAFVGQMNLEMTYLRPFHFFGEGQFEKNFWPSLRKAALEGEDFPMTPGEQIRDFIPVEDVATRFLKEALQPFSFPESQHFPHIRIANLGAGCPRTLREFAGHWWQRWNAKGKLLPGAVPYRENEVMRYVPEVSEVIDQSYAQD